MPSFINSDDVLSPCALYESYVGRDMQGLVSVQFLAAFNRFLGGDTEVSRNAMSEFFHNLSWQSLTNDNDSVQLEFTAITELVRSINHLIQKEIYESNKKTLEVGKDIVERLLRKESETIKTEIEKVEENIVEDIINNDTTDYTPINIVPTVKIEDEIDQNRLEWNRNFLATEIATRQRDLEIIDDIEAKNQVDLIRSAIDPTHGLVTNEEVDQTDYNRTEHNEPLGSQLNPNVLNVMREIVETMSEQTAVIDAVYDNMPPLVDTTERKYTSPEILRPNLRDILAADATNELFSDEIKQEIDKIRQEATDLIRQKTGDEYSDSETIPYAEPDEMSDTETIQYAEPYRNTFSKKDQIYRIKAKKKAIKRLNKKK